jgi:hypothetical protein
MTPSKKQDHTNLPTTSGLQVAARHGRFEPGHPPSGGRPKGSRTRVKADLSQMIMNGAKWSEFRTITITPYRTRAEAAAAEIEAIKNEKPRYNQQRHPAPVEPPIAPAMAGKALFRRLAAARRHGEVPGDSAGFQARIDNALTMLRQDDADAAPGEPQEKS